MDMDEELKTRVINGRESDTHFLYTDEKGNEWSVINMKRLMTKPPMGDFYKEQRMSYERMFNYNWEAMLFYGDSREPEQVRADSWEELKKRICDLEIT